MSKLHWEIWSAHNTRQEAVAERDKSLKSRPRWVTKRFHRATNRIRKYIPAPATRWGKPELRP
jgi:hypothetical protein